MSKLATALLEFQKAAPSLHADASNNHFGNKYLSLEGLMRAIRPGLNQQGLVLMQFPAAIDGQPALRTKLLHAESGEFEEDTMPLMLAKNDPQAQGSGLTYARRYAAMSVLGLVADEDDDGNASSRRSDGAGLTAPPPSASPTAQAPKPPAPSGTFTPPADAQAILDSRGSLPALDGGSPEEIVKTFGQKHNGKKLGQILEEDPSHLRWLAGEKFEAKTPDQRRIKGAAQTLLGMPLSVEVPSSPGEGRDLDIPFERTI